MVRHGLATVLAKVLLRQIPICSFHTQLARAAAQREDELQAANQQLAKDNHTWVTRKLHITTPHPSSMIRLRHRSRNHRHLSCPLSEHIVWIGAAPSHQHALPPCTICPCAPQTEEEAGPGAAGAAGVAGKGGATCTCTQSTIIPLSTATSLASRPAPHKACTSEQLTVRPCCLCLPARAPLRC